MKEIYNTILKYKKGFILGFLILYTVELALTYIKFNGISFYQSITIFVAITLKIFSVIIGFSVYRYLKRKKGK